MWPPQCRVDRPSDGLAGVGVLSRPGSPMVVRNPAVTVMAFATAIRS